jgi:hypothetical protein
MGVLVTSSAELGLWGKVLLHGSYLIGVCFQSEYGYWNQVPNSKGDSPMTMPVDQQLIAMNVDHIPASQGD